MLNLSFHFFPSRWNLITCKSTVFTFFLVISSKSCCAKPQTEKYFWDIRRTMVSMNNVHVSQVSQQRPLLRGKMLDYFIYINNAISTLTVKKKEFFFTHTWRRFGRCWIFTVSERCMKIMMSRTSCCNVLWILYGSKDLALMFCM